MQISILLVFWIHLFIGLSERSVSAGKAPAITMNTTYFSWQSGKTVILRCYISDDKDNIDSVYWIHERENGFLKIITPSTYPDKYSGSTRLYPHLIISNLTSTDIGNYKCAATNEFGTGISKTALFLNVTGPPPNITATRLYYNERIGQNVTLRVSISSPGSVILSVNWIFHNKGINEVINITGSYKYEGSSVDSPALHILNLTSNDIGNYTCSSVNAYGIGKSEFILLEIKDIPKVYIGSESYNASYGHSVTLECKASSKTTLNKVYWERNSNGNIINIFSETAGINGVSIENPGLTINVATSSDSGLYTCVAENIYGIGKSKPSLLHIYGGEPAVRVHGTLINATIGMNVTLHVSINSTPAHFQIYWIKYGKSASSIIHNGTTGTSGGSLLNPSLIIRLLTQSDVGIYQCFAGNALGIGYSENISLSVEGDLPLVKVTEEEHIAHFGDTITIDCTIISYPNYTNVYWEKRRGDIVTTLTNKTKGIRGSTIEKPALTILFVTSTDTGFYTCNTENVIGLGMSRAAKLTVEAGVPIVNIRSTLYNTTYGIPVTLHCDIIADPPAMYVRWNKYVNGHLTHIYNGSVGILGIVPTDPSMTIMSPVKSSTGEYTCSAMNDLGLAESTPTVLNVVGGLPVVSIEHAHHSAMYGESYTIHCYVDAVPLHKDVYWEHDYSGLKRRIKNVTRGVSGVTLEDPSLTIDRATTSDSGSYTCFAENIVGSSNSKSVSFYVDAGKPDVEVPLTRYTIKYGNDVALLCTVNSIPLHTNVYWIKETERGDVILNHGTTGLIGISVRNPSLSFKYASHIDSGLYICAATNIIGTGFSRPVSLIVLTEDNDAPSSSKLVSDTNLLVKILAPVLTTIFGALGAALFKCLGIFKPNVVLQITSRNNADHPSDIRENDTIELTCTNKGLLKINHCTWYVEKKSCSYKAKLKKIKTDDKKGNSCICLKKCKEGSYQHVDDHTTIREEKIDNGFKATIDCVKKEDLGKYSCKARNILRRENISGTVLLSFEDTTPDSSETTAKKETKKPKDDEIEDKNKSKKATKGKSRQTKTSEEDAAKPDEPLDTKDIAVEISD